MKQKFFKVSVFLVSMALAGSAMLSSCGDDELTDVAAVRPETPEGVNPTVDNTGLSKIPTITGVKADEPNKLMTIEGTNLLSLIKVTRTFTAEEDGKTIDGVDYKTGDEVVEDITSTIQKDKSTNEALLLALADGKITAYYDPFDISKIVEDGGFNIPVPVIKENGFATDWASKTMTIEGENLDKVVHILVGDADLVDKEKTEITPSKITLPLWDGEISLNYDMNNPKRVVKCAGYKFPVPTIKSVDNSAEDDSKIVIKGTNFDVVTSLTIAGSEVAIPDGATKELITVAKAEGEVVMTYPFNEETRTVKNTGYVEGTVIYKFSQSPAKTNPWDSNFYLTWEDALELETEYIVTFKAKATMDLELQLELMDQSGEKCAKFGTDEEKMQNNANSWEASYSSHSDVPKYGQKVGTEWTTLELTYKTKKDACDGYLFQYTKFQFGTGKLDGDLYVKDFQIYKKDDPTKKITSFTFNGVEKIVENPTIKVTQETAKTNPWDSNFWLTWEEALELETEYIITIVAKADAELELQLELMDQSGDKCAKFGTEEEKMKNNANSWEASYSSHSDVPEYGVNVDTDWTTITLTYKTKKDACDGYLFKYTKFQFGTGKLEGDLLIDDVQIYKKDDPDKKNYVANSTFDDDDITMYSAGARLEIAAVSTREISTEYTDEVRCLKIDCPAKKSQTWDSQLWIKSTANATFKEGVSYKFHCKARADVAFTPGTGIHGDPDGNNWMDGGVLNGMKITPAWQEFNIEGTFSKSYEKDGNPGYTMAFDLSIDKDNVIYLDDISLEIGGTEVIKWFFRFRRC